MSDTVITDSPGDPAEELPGFFGAEELQPTEQSEVEARALIDEFLSGNPGGRERLIPLLHEVQENLGYLPFRVQEYVAESLGMSSIQVYAVVSFYNFFTTTPRGRYQLKVCMGTACFVRQAQRLLDALREDLDVELGELSEDGLFNLEQARCLGACGLAPAVMVNSRVHGELTKRKMQTLVRNLRSQAERKTEQAGSGRGGEASE